MEIILTTIGWLLLSYVLLNLRKLLISWHIKKATNYIFEQEDWFELLEIHEPADQYLRALYDWRVWTFNQMFPNLMK